MVRFSTVEDRITEAQEEAVKEFRSDFDKDVAPHAHQVYFHLALIVIFCLIGYWYVGLIGYFLLGYALELAKNGAINRVNRKWEERRDKDLVRRNADECHSRGRG